MRHFVAVVERKVTMRGAQAPMQVTHFLAQRRQAFKHLIQAVVQGLRVGGECGFVSAVLAPRRR